MLFRSLESIPLPGFAQLILKQFFPFLRRQKSLEVSADLVERLVAVKAKNGPYWALTSSISDILGVQLSKLVDGLIG